MNYALRIDKQVAKTLKSLDQPTIKRVLARFEPTFAKTLSTTAFHSPLEMEPSVRKSRVGNWRLFFEVNDAHRVIAIVAIKPRSRAYRKL